MVLNFLDARTHVAVAATHKYARGVEIALNNGSAQRES